MQEQKYKKGDTVLVAPHLTGQGEWMEGKVVEVENNTFRGWVVTATTALGDVFDVQDSFKTV
jgi:NOL1/NOP2/fmu family ribosome biogenesis protein